MSEVRIIINSVSSKASRTKQTALVDNYSRHEQWRSEYVLAPVDNRLSGPSAPPFSFLFFLFFFSSLSLGAPFSSGAPGHCPPMPPARYATGHEQFKTRSYFIRVLFPFVFSEEFDVHTTVKYKYLYSTHRFSKSLSFIFRVKASNDVHIALSPKAQNMDKMYEIGELQHFILLFFFS